MCHCRTVVCPLWAQLCPLVLLGSVGAQLLGLAVGLLEQDLRRTQGWSEAAALCGEGLREVCRLQKGWLQGDLAAAFSA